MNISFNPYITNNAYFGKKSDKTNQKTETKNHQKANLKPIAYLGASIIPIAIGVFSIKNCIKTTKKAAEECAKKLPDMASLLPEEKKVVENLIKNGLSQKTAEIFVNVKNIEDKKEFAQKTFDLLFEQTGYSLKPNLVILETAPSSDSLGGWLCRHWSITMYEDTTLKTPKAEIFDTIAHELEHFKQDAIILRTEGIGVDAYSDSMAKRYLKLDKDDLEFCLKNYGKKPEDVTISDIMNHYEIDKYKEKFEQYSQQLINDKGTIKIDSEEGKLARRYLDAGENYTKIDHNADKTTQSIQTVKYLANLLEARAFEEGDKVRKNYEDFIIDLADSRFAKKP